MLFNAAEVGFRFTQVLFDCDLRLFSSCQLSYLIVSYYIPFHAVACPAAGTSTFRLLRKKPHSCSLTPQIAGVVTFAASAPPSPPPLILMLDVPLRL